MKDLRIGVGLDHNIGHRDLHNASEAGDLTSHSGHLPELDEIGEGYIWDVRGGRKRELVEPEDAMNAAGAVVEGKPEESVGSEFTGGDRTDGFSSREVDASARERRTRRVLGEGKKIEGEKLDMSVE